MIHTTIGVYPDGSFKTNGVRSENLASHIWYNLSFRPGRTLYVDGALVYKGIGVSDELHALWGESLDACTTGCYNPDPKGKALEFTHQKDTAPYV